LELEGFPEKVWSVSVAQSYSEDHQHQGAPLAILSSTARTIGARIQTQFAFFM
jgi:hypothetical protein